MEETEKKIPNILDLIMDNLIESVKKKDSGDAIDWSIALKNVHDMFVNMRTMRGFE